MRKKVHFNLCLILNVYWDTTICISRTNLVFFGGGGVGGEVGLDEERSLHNKGGYSGRIAGSHFGCCCLHKETRRSTETKNTRSSHTSCEVHWGWRWDFRKFIVNCKKCYICVTKLSFKYSNKIKIQRTVSNFSFSTASHRALYCMYIQTALYCTFKQPYLSNHLKPDTLFIWTFFLTMTDVITSQNSPLSSWITLYTFFSANIRHQNFMLLYEYT